jgi:hypothetical protein
MSVRNYHYSLRNNPEERSYRLLPRRSLKLHVVLVHVSTTKYINPYILPLTMDKSHIFSHTVAPCGRLQVVAETCSGVDQILIRFFGNKLVCSKSFRTDKYPANYPPDVWRRWTLKPVISVHFKENNV